MDDMIQRVIDRVQAEMKGNKAAAPEQVRQTIEANKQFSVPEIQEKIQKDSLKDISGIFKDVGVTEYVGTAMGPTIGLVLASIDPGLAEMMDLGRYRSIGFIGSRQGFNPQAFATDEAVKATNVEMLKVEAPRDDMGGDGASSYFVIGADDVSDVRRCVEIALSQVEKYYGGIWANEFGHLDMQWTARASYCLAMAFGAEVGAAFGVINAGPTPIGAILADTAVKAANVDIVGYTSCTSGSGFSYANEFTMTVKGDSGAVRQAVKATIEPGRKILSGFGGEAECMAVPYY